MDINYDEIVVRRMKKGRRSSLNHIVGGFRRWNLSRRSNVEIGLGVRIEKSVEVTLCNTAKLSIGDQAVIAQSSWLLLTMPNPTVEIGKHVLLGRHTIVAAKNHISIGDFTVIAPKCYIIDHEHGFSEQDIILNQRSVIKSVSIGRDCYLGTGVLVLGGITIGDGAVVGAGSVVTKDIPEGEFWAGNPARFIKKREGIAYHPNFPISSSSL